MNKKIMLWMILDLIFIIAFNMVFFIATGTQHRVSVWISYIFIHFSYIMLLITPFMIRKSNNTTVLGLPLYFCSSAYFLVTFAVGIIFILVNPESYKANLIIQVIILSIYMVMLISNMIANESTADSIEKHNIELNYIRYSSSKLNGIINLISDKQLKKKVERLYDILHSSPSKSNSSVHDYELIVLKLIDELDYNINRNDIRQAEKTISDIERNANERNRKLKYVNY